MQGAKNNLEGAEAFLSECRNYSQRLDDVIKTLKSSLNAVGYSWRDDDYITISDMIENIANEVEKTRRIADEDIIPYVTKKVEILRDK